MASIWHVLDWIKPIPLFIGFLLGIVSLLYYRPAPVIIYKYPTPQTQNDMIFKDSAGTCFKFSTKDVNCDENEAKIKDFPLQ